MAAWSLETAKSLLSTWLDAEKAVALNQDYSISIDGSSTRRVTRADAAEITNKINFWRREVENLERGLRGGPVVSRIIPIDV